MATYCYKCDACGATKEIVKPISECQLPELCDVDSFVMFRDYHAEHCDEPDTAGNYPMESDAAGVAASQVDEASAHADSIGVPTEFTKEGSAVFRSKKHRKDYCEAIGLYDKNGGYSDPQRK